jgi:hypothetical protein
VWNAFVALVSSDPSEPFTREQSAAALVFWYESEVKNGGHHQYFSNRGLSEAMDAIEALQELNAPRHALVLSSALASIRGSASLVPISVTEYVATAQEDPFGQFDRAFHEASPPLRVAMEAYLALHLSAFVALEGDGA